MGKGHHSASPSSKDAGDKNGDLLAQDTTTRDGKKDSTTENEYVKPPDGGWGWMVVFASFLIHVIADGVVYSFGVFLMEFVDYFKSGRGPTSWVGSLQPAVTFTVGPLSSALTNRFGCKKVTIAGAIVAATGFVLSAFATNLYYLYVTSGIMAGVGFGLIYLPAIVCVAQYFEKRRSFATGLAVCGSGFGTFILAPLTEFLVHEYRWQGAMLILGGIILNVIVCGLLFRPLEASDGLILSSSGNSSISSPTTNEKERLLPSSTTEEMSSRSVTVAASPTDSSVANVEEIEVLVDQKLSDGSRFLGQGEGVKGKNLTEVNGLEIINSLQQLNALPNGRAVLVEKKNGTHTDAALNTESTNRDPNVSDTASSSPEPSYVSHQATVMDANTSPPSLMTSSPPVEMLQMNSIVGSTGFSADLDEGSRSLSQSLFPPNVTNMKMNHVASIAQSEGALHIKPIITPVDVNGGGAHVGCQRRAVRVSRHSESASSSTLAPLTRKDIFYSGSLLNIPMYRSQPDMYMATVSSHEADIHDKEAVQHKEESGCLDISKEFKQTMKDMLSLTLLRNPVFLMFAISNFFTSIGFNMPFIFLPDRAKLAGIDEDRAAWLLSVIGIANTAGRVIFGFLSDRPWMNRLMLYNTALTICGIATALSPLVGGDYGLLVAYAAVFGIFIGVYVSLTSVVLVDLLGLEYLTNSFGLLLLFQGAATFIGPPIAGWLCDWTGSYDISFIVMGSLIAVSGAMLYFLPLVERYYAHKVPMVNIVRDINLGKKEVDTSEAGDASKMVALA